MDWCLINFRPFPLINLSFRRFQFKKNTSWRLCERADVVRWCLSTNGFHFVDPVPIPSTIHQISVFIYLLMLFTSHLPQHTCQFYIFAETTFLNFNILTYNLYFQIRRGSLIFVGETLYNFDNYLVLHLALEYCSNNYCNTIVNVHL